MDMERALIGIDLRGVPTILATDGTWISELVSEISVSAEEIGLCGQGKDGKPDEHDFTQGPGLYLFTGIAITTYDWESGKPDGSDWHGEIRPVRPEEIAELYAMKPPPMKEPA